MYHLLPWYNWCEEGGKLEPQQCAKHGLLQSNADRCGEDEPDQRAATLEPQARERMKGFGPLASAVSTDCRHS